MDARRLVLTDGERWYVVPRSIVQSEPGGHKVRTLDGERLRVNAAAIAPFEADQDGVLRFLLGDVSVRWDTVVGPALGGVVTLLGGRDLTRGIHDAIDSLSRGRDALELRAAPIVDDLRARGASDAAEVLEAFPAALQQAVLAQHPYSPEDASPVSVARAARSLLSGFVSADPEAALLRSVRLLRPGPSDYAAAFSPDQAPVLRQWCMHGPWAPPGAAPIGAPGQTAVDVYVATADELRARQGGGARFPGGWRRVAPYLNNGPVWVRWRYRAPDEADGTAYDGLAWMGDRWAWFGPVWRALR